MAKLSLREFELAALRHDMPELGLVSGDIGTVVHVYNEGEAYEVEFFAKDGRTIAVETVMSDDLQPVATTKDASG